MKLSAVDLYCGAGGVTKGLQQAGFIVTGVDHKPQPRYVGESFIEANALEFDVSKFDFVWASPPCQRYCRMNKGLLASQGRSHYHPDDIGEVREKLIKNGAAYIIENVGGAPLLDPVMLCGSSFGLHVQRHRFFESNVMLLSRPCVHGYWVKDKPAVHRLQGKSRIVGCYGNGRGQGDTVSAWRSAMGIDWMTRRELSQAIPPAYAEFLGRQIAKVILQEKSLLTTVGNVA